MFCSLKTIFRKYVFVIVMMCLVFPGTIHAKDAEVGSYQLAVVDVPYTCNSFVLYKVSQNHAPKEVAIALYQLIRFTFESYEYVGDTKNTLYTKQFGDNPSDMITYHRNGAVVIAPMSIQEIESSYSNVSVVFKKQFGKDLNDIIAFRKKYAFTTIKDEDEANRLFLQAQKLLEPFVKHYHIEVSEDTTGNC